MVAIGLFAVASTAFAATPSVVSVKLTGSNIITVVYSEPVTTNSWDYTNFTGNLSGLGVTSISGSGSNVITLTLSGTPVVSQGTSGYLTIGSGVISVSTGSAFPGASYNVTSAQAPILSSVSVSVVNSGNTFSAVGSQIMLTFSTNEAVVNPTVTLLGHTIGVSGTGPGPYTVNYTLVSGDAQGTVNATIMFTDTNGNSGSATVNVLSNGTGSTVSANGYISSNANSTGVLYSGNSITFTLVPSTPEPSVRSVTGSYNGVPLSWYTTNNGVTYTAVYTVAAGQSEYRLSDPDKRRFARRPIWQHHRPVLRVGCSKDDHCNGRDRSYHHLPSGSDRNADDESEPQLRFCFHGSGYDPLRRRLLKPDHGRFSGLEHRDIQHARERNSQQLHDHRHGAAGNVSNQLVISPFTIGTVSTTAPPVASSSDLTVQMQALQNQLAELQAKASGSGTAAPYNFTEFLNVGSQDAQVTALQQRLKTDGFYSGPITGFYASLTETAVGKYQTAHGIDPAGYVGPSTRAALQCREIKFITSTHIGNGEPIRINDQGSIHRGRPRSRGDRFFAHQPRHDRFP